MPRRGENIRKRTDGRWEGRYIESYSNNGKACYRSVYGTTYADTKEKLKQYKKLCKNTGSKITVKDLCTEWLKMKEVSLKPSSYVKYNNSIEKHILPYFKKLKAMYLTSDLVNDFVHEKNYLSEKTIHDLLSLFIQIIKYGQSKNYIGYFNFNSIVFPKIASKELAVLKKSEFTRLVSYVHLTFEIQKIGILLSLFMGIRLGEICALKWENVNFSEETIRIEKTMQRIKNLEENAKAKTKIVIDVPKSQKSIRDIPIPSFILKLLKKYKSDENNYLLTGTVKYIEPRMYQDMFKTYLKESGINDINFHALRHTFATRAIEQEFDIKSLSEILGHSSVKFTLERYVHPSDEYKKKNLEKLKIFY